MKASLRVFVITSALLLFGEQAATAASDSAAYTYDQNGRLWTVTYANGTTITYTYDTAGNRQQVVVSCSSGGC